MLIDRFDLVKNRATKEYEIIDLKTTKTLIRISNELNMDIALKILDIVDINVPLSELDQEISEYKTFLKKEKVKYALIEELIYHLLSKFNIIESSIQILPEDNYKVKIILKIQEPNEEEINQIISELKLGIPSEINNNQELIYII